MAAFKSKCDRMNLIVAVCCQPTEWKWITWRVQRSDAWLIIRDDVIMFCKFVACFLGRDVEFCTLSHRCNNFSYFWTLLNSFIYFIRVFLLLLTIVSGFYFFTNISVMNYCSDEIYYYDNFEDKIIYGFVNVWIIYYLCYIK